MLERESQINMDEKDRSDYSKNGEALLRDTFWKSFTVFTLTERSTYFIITITSLENGDSPPSIYSALMMYL